MTATPPRFVDPEQFDLTPVHLSSAEVQPDAYRSELPFRVAG